VPASLRVEVVQASDLPRADMFGLSDPFVTLKLNGIELKTKVMKNTLSPKWEQELVFEEDQMRSVWREQEFTVSVSDWNATGAVKLLGTTTLQVCMSAHTLAL